MQTIHTGVAIFMQLVDTPDPAPETVGEVRVLVALNAGSRTGAIRVGLSTIPVTAKGVHVHVQSLL